MQILHCHREKRLFLGQAFKHIKFNQCIPHFGQMRYTLIKLDLLKCLAQSPVYKIINSSFSQNFHVISVFRGFIVSGFSTFHDYFPLGMGVCDLRC